MLKGAFGRSDAEIDLLVRGMRSGITRWWASATSAR